MKEAFSRPSRAGAHRGHAYRAARLLQRLEHLRIRRQRDSQMSGDLFALLAHPLLELVGGQRVDRSRGRCPRPPPRRDGPRPASSRTELRSAPPGRGGVAKVLPDSLLAQLLAAERRGHTEPGQETVGHLGRGVERRCLGGNRLSSASQQQRGDRRRVERCAQMSGAGSSQHQLPLVVAASRRAAWVSRRARRCQ